MSLISKFRLLVELVEEATGDLFTKNRKHKLQLNATRASGSGSSQNQYAWSDTRSVTSGVADPLDIRGGLTNSDDSTVVSIPTVTGFWIQNHSTTPGQNLVVGGGSNPFITWLGASGDQIVIGPGGTHFIESPIDGYATTAGTADILQIAASSGTISYSAAIWGRD